MVCHAVVLVQGVGGGKLHVMLGSLSRIGAHALAARDGNPGPATAMQLMQPHGKDYDQLAEAAAEAQVGLHPRTLEQLGHYAVQLSRTAGTLTSWPRQPPRCSGPH